MKKFLSLLLLFGSLSVYAGSPTCRVLESKNNVVATLDRTNVMSDGQPSVWTYVRLTKAEPQDVTVVVEAWEGNQCVGTTPVTIKAGQTHAIASLTGNNGIKHKTSYRLAISEVTCQ